MRTVSVSFRRTEDVMNFVGKVSRFSCNADLVSGNRAVDAKSLMGAIAISQASDLRLVLHESSQTVIAELLAGIQDYISCDKRSACAPAAS